MGLWAYNKTIMPLGELPVSCLVFLVFLDCPPKPWLVLVEAQACRGLTKGRLVVLSRTWQCSKTPPVESWWDGDDMSYSQPCVCWEQIPDAVHVVDFTKPGYTLAVVSLQPLKH